MLKLIQTNEDHIKVLNPQVDPALIGLKTGPALTLVDGTRILACGGIRMGIGEAWSIIDPSFAQYDTRLMLRSVRDTFKALIEECNNWQVFAFQKFDNVFIKHMGFNPIPQRAFGKIVRQWT